MTIRFVHNDRQYKADLSRGMDISIPLAHGQEGPNCFYAPLYEALPLKAGDFIGDTRKGAPVNFYNVRLNPHGNGTHTECVGHIAVERVSINNVLQNCHCVANLITIYPQIMDNGDRVITLQQIDDILAGLESCQALIIRTMPNHEDKKSRMYSGTNPPYIDHEAIAKIVAKEYIHLLVDLPSVDREEDGGRLSGHKAFWNYPQEINVKRTITELIYVPDHIKDGRYFINLQIPSFELDAASSRVFLFEMSENEQ
jgi:arylformamidase